MAYGESIQVTSLDLWNTRTVRLRANRARMARTNTVISQCSARIVPAVVLAICWFEAVLSKLATECHAHQGKVSCPMTAALRGC